VAARANDGGYLGVDDLLAFLVGQTIDVWPRSGSMINQTSKQPSSERRQTPQEQRDDVKVWEFDD
jgi:hypothetical protein